VIEALGRESMQVLPLLSESYHMIGIKDWTVLTMIRIVTVKAATEEVI